MKKLMLSPKNFMMRILSFGLVSLMVFGNIPVTVNAEEINTNKTNTEELQLLTYEEYVEQQENLQNADLSIVMQNKSDNDNKDTMKTISDLTEGKDTIICGNVEELVPAANIEEVQSEVSITRSAPVVALRAVVLNPDSMKNGQYTTETQIAWLWEENDADGDTILQREIGGFPFSYLLGELNNGLGFVTQFNNPGNFAVLYRVTDSAGEVSEIFRYELDVVPVEDYQVIEGGFTASDEVQTYNVEVDFSNMDEAAFCLVKSGKSDISMTIVDSEGKETAIRETDKWHPRKWYFLEKPSANTTIATYTITVKLKTYDESSSGFRVMIGNKKDTEAMISGVENAVLLDLYFEEARNQCSVSYTPNRDESWYRFTADGNTVFTLMTHFPQTRFQIRDVDDLYVLFDSNDSENENVHKSQFCTAGCYAEKARLTTTIGQDYYLVIYSPSVISTEDLIEETVNAFVGRPAMVSGYTTVYASSSITANKSGYSSSANILVGDNGKTIPLTAVVDNVSIRSLTSGIRLSMIELWRIKYPSSNMWVNTTGSFHNNIEIGYVKDSDLNNNINGTWQISVKAAASSSPITFVPGIHIYYYYEIGD